MKIAWDGGHSLNTPGKRSPDGKLIEHWFNSRVASKADALLKTQYDNVETIIVHDPSGQIDVPRMKRVERANVWGADVYVSIHGNGDDDPDIPGQQWTSANGIETFIYSTKPKEAYSLAAYVQNELIRATGRRNRGVKLANFDVLKFAKMTSILVELGFMTNKEEYALMLTDAYQDKCAAALVKGIAEFYKLHKKKAEVKPMTTTAKTEEAKPVDHTPSPWAKQSWEKACKKKGKDGKPIFDGTNPKEPLTREQAAAVLDRLGLLD